ncbi:XRE family transcriptional regulator [Burkholderia pseudomultivorans]|uniref:XRE family transcriptional regulator n=1 Tax=Burkholderia pseudomultivorans TaxID=1207504 RepID=UPI00188EFB41|nr:XRE family transcriptional regulator [Burkholderia pseudomultivorans]MBF5008366.1 XRE family transcriptional regulator [Burkholderia pseudomultivorans]
MKRRSSHRRAGRPPAESDSDFDLDLADEAMLAAKSRFVQKLNMLMATYGLSEAEAAAIAEMVRPPDTPAQRERLRNVSLDQLIMTLMSFGQHVEIVVTPAERPGLTGITVSS